MASYISYQPSDFFNVVEYTGTGAGLTVTGVGFSADSTLIKNYTGSAEHAWRWTDTVRGYNSQIATDNADAESTSTSALTSWNSDGFVLGAPVAAVNGSGLDFISYNWKAGTTSGKPTTSETITPSAYSYSVAQGISILKYAGTGSSGYINHGLGVVPKVMYLKNLDSGQWLVGSPDKIGVGYYMELNSTASRGGSSWDCNVTADTIELNGTSATGASISGNDYVLYAFTNARGFARHGGYVGNGNADGPFIYTGFRPAMTIIKKIYATESWYVGDKLRPGYNTNNYYQLFNTPAGQGTSTSIAMSMLSNGIKINNSDSAMNSDGTTYMYSAFAEFPFVSSNSKAGTAR